MSQQLPLLKGGGDNINKVCFGVGESSKDNVFTKSGDFIKLYEYRIVCIYNVTSTTEATQLLYSDYDLSNIASMEIDEVDTTVASSYTFSTTGNHTVKYSLKEGVTSIADYAFQNCTNLISVTIGDSVTSIGYRAFYKCTRLTNIVISNSVETIANSAFSFCYNLTSITIPDSVTSLGSSLSAVCPNLTSISVDGSNIVYNSKNNCNAIIETETNTLMAGCKNTVIPDSVTSIYKFAFSNCYGLTSITIPDSVTSIGYAAFVRCSGLTSVTIGNSVTSIDMGAFSECSGLTSITIPDSVTSIGGNAFDLCSGLTSVTIGNSVTSIGKYAFSSCTNLTSIIYNGTMAQWKAMSRVSNWHWSVPSTTTVTCTDGTCGLDDTTTT